MVNWFTKTVSKYVHVIVFNQNNLDEEVYGKNLSRQANALKKLLKKEARVFWNIQKNHKKIGWFLSFFIFFFKLLSEFKSLNLSYLTHCPLHISIRKKTSDVFLFFYRLLLVTLTPKIIIEPTLTQ